MAKDTYTDNTLATDPPGGKRHTVGLGEAADALPPEDGLGKAKPRRATARKVATSRKSAMSSKQAKSRVAPRKPAAASRKATAKKAKPRKSASRRRAS